MVLLRLFSARGLVGCLALLILIAGGALPASAQVAAGQITGAVADQSGASIPGATVWVINAATNQARSTMTTAQGFYTVPSLSPGQYRVQVALAGFQTM